MVRIEQDAGCVGGDGRLQLTRVWPYWLQRPQRKSSSHTHAALDEQLFEGVLESDGEDQGAAGGVVREAVGNNVEVGQRIMLLTGANMSGKSTLMRATMATALLGSVGLPVPCNDATIPEVRSAAHSKYPSLGALSRLDVQDYKGGSLRKALTSVHFALERSSCYRASSICFVRLVSLLMPLLFSGAIALTFLSW